MHEMSITESVLEIVGEEMARNNLKTLKSLKLRVGELTAVEPEALRFCFEACIKGTPFEGALLEIEEVPLTGKCPKCLALFPLRDFVNACPACGQKPVEKATGTELDIVSMDAF